MTGGQGEPCDSDNELVEVSGLEPLTFWLPAKRSPN
jgi:hypothetical protein